MSVISFILISIASNVVLKRGLVVIKVSKDE